MEIKHEQKFVTLYTFINFLKSGKSENSEEFLNSICVTAIIFPEQAPREGFDERYISDEKSCSHRRAVLFAFQAYRNRMPAAS